MIDVEEVRNSLCWTTGGAQGTGVDSSANIFARACAFSGLTIFGKREYYSNIKGEHSYFQVRVQDGVIRSHRDIIDLLATFDEETVVRHALQVVPDGGIIYDVEQMEKKISSIPTIEERVVRRINSTLSSQGLGETVGDVLEEARRRGVHLYPMPYSEILKEVGKAIAQTQLSVLARMTNMLAVATSFSLLKYDVNTMNEAIKRIFRAKPKVAEQNILAAKLAYDYAEKYRGSFRYRLEKVPTDGHRIFVTGFQSLGIGKLLGGCRFQTYYPITPASDESVFLEDNEVFDLVKPSQAYENPQLEEVKYMDGTGSVLVVQSEDEIAAITMATGAGLAGVRASTSTSGPGFCLMAEGLGWAGMNEVPVVVTLYQRGGPSTGLPTRTEQGDLRFALHIGHGEFPRIILSSGDIEECFYDAIKAFNYAERYQLPVIHIVDKALANSYVTIRDFDAKDVRIDRGEILTEKALLEMVNNGGYQRFAPTDTGISPRAILGQAGGVFWNTGDEHDEVGHITEDPENRDFMMDKRMKKLKTASREIPESEKYSFYGDEDAETYVVSWGSTKGAILDAMDSLAAEGRRLGFLQVRLIWPFPTEGVSGILSRAKRRIGIEMNYSGQFAGIVKENTGIAMDSLILKYNGRSMSCDEVVQGIKEVLSTGNRRVVLTHGA